MSDDTALGDTTPTPATHPFGDPNGHTVEHPPARRMLTVEEVLASAELPEKYARVCLKANLQAEHDDLVAQLAGMVDARGELIDDDESSAGEVSGRGRAFELNDRLVDVRRQMADSMWFPLFRGLSSEDMAVFQKANLSKGDADNTEFNMKLIAECSVEPKMSVDDVKALRKKLGTWAMVELSNTANEVCARGGVDVPKLPVFLHNLTQQ